jgi:hypothetical protein
MALVVQSFGNEREYRRAILTVVSYYAFTPPSDAMKTLLFTDRPEYFKNMLNGFPVEFISLTAEKIRQMRGEIDFLHHMKIALIEEAFQKSDDNLLYADSDAFFVSDPTPLFRRVSPTKAFMHVFEYAFDALKTWTPEASQKFYDRILNRTLFLADGSTFVIGPQHASWNAGAMMLHREHASQLANVYALTRQIFPETQHHASEQFAFSVVLQTRVDLEPCESVIYHYWYRVMKQVADTFLEQSVTVAWSLQDSGKKKEQVRKWVQVLSRLFKEHVLMLRDNAIQAFNENDFATGYRFALKAILKQPLNFAFLKDVAYHTRRNFIGIK